MSSIISPHGVVLATAMAVSGTVVLLMLRLQKSLSATQFPVEFDQVPQSSQPPILRSCISTEGKKSEKKEKKRVHFAEDVVDPSGDGERYRRQHDEINKSSSYSSSTSLPPKLGKSSRGETRGMPANRMALYNGMLRDRVVQRLAYSC